MLQHSGTRAAGNFNITTWSIDNEDDRKEFCRIFLETGKLFILETLVSDKSISITEPLK